MMEAHHAKLGMISLDIQLTHGYFFMCVIVQEKRDHSRIVYAFHKCL